MRRRHGGVLLLFDIGHADRATRAPVDPARGVGPRFRAAGLANGIALYPSSGTIDGVRGDHVIVGKGVCVKLGSVVGARSLVNKTFPRFSLLGGTPAKRIRGDVTWTRHGDGAPGFVGEMRAYADSIPEFTAKLRQ